MFESPNQSLKRAPSSQPSLSEYSQMTRKIRVIFQDPYATDSSSSEDEAEVKVRRPVRKVQKVKPIVREIRLPVPGLSQAQVNSLQSESSSQDSNSRSPKTTPDGTSKPKKAVGIRQRKWGKWAAEIKNPIEKKRVWIGTYSSLEEATQAYNAKKKEYEMVLAASSAKAGTLPSSAAASSTSEQSESLVSHTSPSAVPEIDTSASPPPVPITLPAPMSNNDAIVDPITEVFEPNFEGIPISDIFFADEPLFPASVGQELNLAAQFDDFIVKNDFESLLGDYCGIEDLDISGILGDEPSDLPDYDFNTEEFIPADAAPLNIACL